MNAVADSQLSALGGKTNYVRSNIRARFKELMPHLNKNELIIISTPLKIYFLIVWKELELKLS